jgi:PEP-CTERM motif
MKSSHFAARAAVVLLALTPLVKADIISSLGNTASGLVSGTHYTSLQLLAALTGAAPFNAVCGNITTTDCSTSWTFSYLFPSGQTVTGATLTLGIGNLDSSVTGNQVASYLVGTTDLTAALNTVAEGLDGGTGSTRNEYDVLTINLPGTAFTTLQSGSTEVSFALQGPGLGVLGTTNHIAADLVFSTLDIQTAAPVPEPAALPLLLTAVGAFGLLWARRKSNHRG